MQAEALKQDDLKSIREVQVRNMSFLDGLINAMGICLDREQTYVPRLR